MKRLFHLFALVLLANVMFTSCASEGPRVKIETEYGDMIMTLRDDTPKHKENFLKLVEEGYYDDLLFHRVMRGFMIQGGDPNSRDSPAGAPLGMGGPGYTIPAEFTGGLHIKGAVAAARTPDQGNPAKASSGSQFYIVDGRAINPDNVDAVMSNSRKKYTPEERQAYIDAGAGAPFLDDEYTVFGQVVEGLDIIEKIAMQRRDQANRPLEDIPMKLSIIK